MLSYREIFLNYGKEPGMTEPNYDESNVPSYQLPELLTAGDQSKISTAFDWIRKRRPEVLQILKKEMFGELPSRPELFSVEELSFKNDALENTAIRKEFRLTFSNKGKSHSFIMLLYVPKNANGPVPVFLGLNFKGNHTTTPEPDVIPTGRDRNGTLLNPEQSGIQKDRWIYQETVKRGFASATVCYQDIFPDDKAEDAWEKSCYALFSGADTEKEFHPCGSAISCWAWGLSRMLDALENEPLVNAEKAIVHGHSRLGKTSLWAGANDPRFRLVISNDSGCCGAALHRRKFGETIEAITRNFPHWFVSSFRNYAEKEELLPFDQHFLVALSAPRPVCIASATEDLWADPKGEFLSGLHASEVYQLFGVSGMPENTMPEAGRYLSGAISYHLRSGKHDQLLFDWLHYFELADRFIR